MNKAKWKSVIRVKSRTVNVESFEHRRVKLLRCWRGTIRGRKRMVFWFDTPKQKTFDSVESLLALHPQLKGKI